MKNIFYTCLTATALIFTTSVKADGHGNGGNCGGGWSQEFELSVFLTPTASVPTNALAVASLHTEDDCATNTTEVKVKVAGLVPADYTVTVTDFTGTNSYDLGTFTVTTNLPCDFDDADDFVWNAGTNSVSLSTNITTFGNGKFVLPVGLDPTNVAYLFVFDTNGVVDFTGDFTGSTNIVAVYFSENVSVTPGTATAASGTGKVVLSYANGKTTSNFQLTAGNLPTKQSLSINANGKKSTSANTSSSGTVNVNKLPHTDLAALQLLEAKDKKGNVVFSVKF